MDKIKVKAEGREGVYIIAADEAIKLIKQQVKGHIVHHQFTNIPGMVVGADWNKSSVYEHLKNPEVEVALLLEPNFNMGHCLVAINRKEEDRSQFDIGKVTPDMLEVIK